VSGIPFYNSARYTFENGLPEGLLVADWPTGLNWEARASNVKFNNGYLELWVPGGQTGPTYQGAEVDTVASNIAYGSFRTVAVLTQTPGVCNGRHPRLSPIPIASLSGLKCQQSLTPIPRDLLLQEQLAGD
jgi:hypothetical protein